MTVVVAQPSDAEVRKEIRAIKEAASKINSSQKKARAFLLAHGFITADNKLSKRYG